MYIVHGWPLWNLNPNTAYWHRIHTTLYTMHHPLASPSPSLCSGFLQLLYGPWQQAKKRGFVKALRHLTSITAIGILATFLKAEPSESIFVIETMGRCWNSSQTWFVVRRIPTWCSLKCLIPRWRHVSQILVRGWNRTWRLRQMIRVK